MMVPDTFVDEGPYVAVIDGKFLPIHSIQIEERVDANRMYSGQSIQSKGVNVASKEYTITLSTRRRPGKLLSHSSYGYIFSPVKKIALNNVVTISKEVFLDDTGWGQLFEIELTCVSYSVEDR